MHGCTRHVHSKPNRHSGVTAAIAMLFVLAAAACGSSGSAAAPTPLHVVLTASTTTLHAKTARVVFSESVRSKSTSGSNESTTVTGSGLVDLSNQGFELTINAPSGGSQVVLETGGVVFTQVPPASRSEVPGGKPWVSIDLNQVDEAKLGRSFSQLASVDSDSPAEALSNLAGVSDRVTRGRSSTIDGTATTEYVATVDLSKEAAKVGAKEGARARQAIVNEAQALGTHVLPVQVWVQSDGLVKRVSEQTPIPAASAGATNGTGTATITMTFSDFGTPAPLVPPPSSEVADITAQVIQEARAGTG